jgi:hypothetical protein
LSEHTKKSAIPGVSRWYRFDWQYAADLNKLPFVQEAAFLISITPILVWVSGVAFPTPQATGGFALSMWLLWMAAISFVSARLLYYLACPKFIREYRDFGQYVARQHSHRWIVWEFYHNLERLSGWGQIVRETSPKGLTVEIGELPSEICRRLNSVFTSGPEEELMVFTPVNIDRDIYLPICAEGKKLALPMRESDPDLPKKEKELFWILYSQAAKERPKLRTIYWALVATAAILVAAIVLRRVYCIFACLVV